MTEISKKYYCEVKNHKTEIEAGKILVIKRGNRVVFFTNDKKSHRLTEKSEKIFANIIDKELKDCDIEFHVGLGPNTGKLHILNKDESQSIVYRTFAIKDDSVKELETNKNTRVGNNTYVDIRKNKTTLRLLFTSGTDSETSQISVGIEINPKIELSELK